MMYGWDTQSFPAYEVIHLRPVGTRGGTHILKARFRQGLADYSLGSHGVFMFFKSLRRMFLEKPYLIGSLARYMGYLYGNLKLKQNNVPSEAIAYLRKEQMKRLFSFELNRE